VPRVWRFFTTWWLDVLIVLAALESAIGTVSRTDAGRPDDAALLLEGLALAAVILTLCARRRFPFGAPAALWVGAATLSFFDGFEVTSQAGIFICGLAAAVLLGSLRSARGAGAGLVVVLGGAGLVVYNDPTHQLSDLVFTAIIFGVGWGAGVAMRDRTHQAEAAEERAVRAERERESAARLAVAEERARMARELHDVVAHAVSVMGSWWVPSATGCRPRRRRSGRRSATSSRRGPPPSPRCAASSAP
jgi:signal transduction histidine kinase